MTNRIAKFIKKEVKDRKLYDLQECGCGCSFGSLSDEDANLVDEAIRLYKLPFEISENQNKIIDLEFEDEYDLDEGLGNIADAIQQDNGELLDKYMSEEDQMKLYKLLIWA